MSEVAGEFADRIRRQLEAIDKLRQVEELAPEAYAPRVLQHLAAIRDDAETYTRVAAEFAARQPLDLSTRRLARSVNVSHSTLLRWMEYPLTYDAEARDIEIEEAKRPGSTL